VRSNVIGLIALLLIVPAFESFAGPFFHWRSVRLLPAPEEVKIPLWERLAGFARYLLHRMVLLALCLAAASVALRCAHPVASFVDKLIGSANTRILIGGLVCIIGILMYEFKRVSRYLYGFVEVMFAVSSGFAIALSVTDSLPSLAQTSALTGCVYVVASGMDNMKEGKTVMRGMRGRSDF
jgi:hypothetical protein